MRRKYTIQKIGFLLLLLLKVNTISSQTYWAQASGGNDVDEAMDVIHDASGNIYSTGYFTNSAAFGSNTLTSVSSGIPDGYVYKTNSAGQILWVTKFGGIGSDRGLSIRFDGSGNVFVTGYYYGLSTFGTFTLSSVSASQDIFIAKLDPNGNFLWVRSAGGSMVDIPSNIAIDNTGDVIVTGSFQGIATFGTSTFTSMINPSTSVYSYDAFTVKYSNSGTYQWCKTGSAKFTDRGMDIITDSNNDIYVCGQFSDTIMFDVLHTNNIMNAVYLIKYSSAGNEIWFRKASASSSIAYALAVNSNNEIFMAGDFTGTMAFYGTVNNFVTGTYTNKMYLAKYDKSGNFIWGTANSSQNYISARNLALDNAGDAYIIGEFGCTLTDFSDATDKGLYNSIGYSDIFVVKHLGSTGARSWMRNIGGPAKDEAHGITVLSANNPVIAGSYERRFTWPHQATVPCPIYPTNKQDWGIYAWYQASNYCTDSNYDGYYSVVSAGFSDAFVGRIINLNRQPYDYYKRSGSVCTRPFVKSCINYTSTTCPDTIKMCGPNKIHVNTNTDMLGYEGDIGPYHHFKWSPPLWPADTTQSTYTVSLSGSYNVSVTTMDGCYTSLDTVYVKVHPIPAFPHVTDTKGFNTQKFPNTNLIKMCKPDTVKITGGFIKGNSFAWSVSPGGPWLSTPDSSVITTKGGLYAFTLTSPYGCKRTTTVQVQVDSIKPIIPKINLADTVKICCGTLVFVNLYDSILNPIGSPTACIGIIDTLKWYITPGSASISNSPNCSKPEDAYINTCTSGSYTITGIIKINNLCGVKTYTVTKVVYIKVNPNPVINLSYTGLAPFCPGDSVKIIINHNYPIQWSIGGSINMSNFTKDTIWIKIAGFYSISSSFTNSLGCTSTANVWFNIAPKPNPFLTLSPKIICPNDSVKITCNIAGALNYQWIGPAGPYSNTQFIWVKIPGFYHCVVTDATGCVLTSNTVEVKVYNTPYLFASPSPIFCLGGNAILTVVTNDPTNIQWQSPLFGGGTVQTVYTTGTYSVKVTACGITTTCTLSVIASAAIASITPSATNLCPGDSILLTANNGMAGYNWMPGNTMNTNIYVYTAGIYSLTTTDINGCTKSTTIAITQNTAVPLPATSPTVNVCSGNSATLTATGSGTVGWYSQPLVGGFLANGNTYITGPITTNTVYYVTNMLGVCNSTRIPVSVNVVPSSITPTISVNTPVCKGDTIKLISNTAIGATYNWSGPNSFTSGFQNPWIIVTGTVNAGAYQLFLSGGGCTSATSMVFVAVTVPAKPYVATNQTLCVGDTIKLNGYTTNATALYNWSGPLLFSSNSPSTTIAPASANQSGVYSLYTIYKGCKSDTACVNVKVNNFPLLNSYLFSSGCSNDSITMFADTMSGVTYNWSGPGGFSSNSNPVTIYPITAANAGVYTFFANNGGCIASNNTFTINYFLAPVINLGPDSLMCYGTGLTFTVSNYPYILWQDSTANTSYNVYNTPGLYWVMVVDSNGCMGSDSININYTNCESLITPNVFTPNGDGINDIFYIKGHYMKKETLFIYDRWGTEVYNSLDVDKGWDGTNMRNDKKCEAGTFFYIVEVILFDGRHRVLKGYISLFH